MTKKEFETSVNNYKAKYQFITEKVAESLGVNPEEVYYVKGWMDSDNDRVIDYNEEILIEVIEPEEKITVIVELPHTTSEGLGALGLAGHTAMAIGNRYFDYGPELNPNVLKEINEKKYDADFNGDGDKEDILDLSKRLKNINQDIKTMIKDLQINEISNIIKEKEDINLFAPGRSWWGGIVANKMKIQTNEVLLQDILDFILPHWTKNGVYGEVFQVEFYVKKSQADKMIDWWENKYKKLNIYSVRPYTGEQCTTTVIKALKAGEINVIDFDTLTPQGILEDLKEEVKSTSRQHKGEKVTLKIIKKEAIDWP